MDKDRTHHTEQTHYLSTHPPTYLPTPAYLLQFLPFLFRFPFLFHLISTLIITTIMHKFTSIPKPTITCFFIIFTDIRFIIKHCGSTEISGGTDWALFMMRRKEREGNGLDGCMYTCMDVCIHVRSINDLPYLCAGILISTNLWFILLDIWLIESLTTVNLGIIIRHTCVCMYVIRMYMYIHLLHPFILICSTSIYPPTHLTYLPTQHIYLPTHLLLVHG